MHNIKNLIKRFFLSAILIAGIFLISEQWVKSYAAWPTHSFLTGQMAELYNEFSGEKLTDEEIGWLKEGAVAEDDAPRWLNHFYDPTTGLGWNGHNLLINGKLEIFPIVALIGQKGLIGGNAISAVAWFDNQAKQTEYADYSGDQSLTKAIQAYAIGDKKTAFIALGHILHLAADMTVPAHTRQDTHSLEGLNDGDPYETWLKNENNLTIKNWQEITAGYPSFNCADIKSCLIKLATYTNHYFFSKDTIDNEYQYPKVLFYQKEIIDGLDIKFGYGKDENNKNFRLTISKNNNLTIDDTDFLNSDYYSRLSKQAIMGGAEIIRLFKEQADQMSAEEAKNQPVVQSGQKLFSFLGDYLKIKPKVDSFMGELASAAKLVLSFYTKKAEMESFAAEKAVDLFAPKQLSPAVMNSGIIIDESEPKATIVLPDVDLLSQPVSVIPAEAGIQVDMVNYSQLTPIHAPYEPHSNSLLKKERESEDEHSVIPEQSGTQTNETVTTINLDSRFRGNDNISDPGSALPANLSYEQPLTLSVIPAQAGIQAPLTPSDTEAPDIKINLKDYKLTFLSFTVFWQSSSTDIGYYEVQWKDNDDWAEWINNSSSTEQIFDAPDDNATYQFRARAVDLAGNKSEWENIEAEICVKPVVINEIAWMGTGSDSKLNKDEWIELYNKSNQDLNLDKWSLTGGNGGPNIAFASTSIISAKSYFLIERTDDDTVSDIKADLIANFGNGLNDDGESLILKNQDGEIIDALLEGEWFSGDKDNRQTMERINPYLSTDLSNNWQTNDGKIINGIAADEKTLINGTPREPNSVFNLDYVILAYTWSKPKIIDTDWSPAYVASPSIVLDNKNNPRLIYRSAGGGNPANLFYIFYNGASWQTKYAPYTLVNSLDLQSKVASPTPHLALDANNQPNVIFTAGIPNQYHLYFNNLEGNDWGTSLNLSGTSTQAYFSDFSIGQDGRLHTAWETTLPDFEIFYRSFSSGGGWSETIQVSSSSEIVLSPTMAIDSNNNPHLAWFEYSKYGGIKGIGIYYSTLTVGVWAEPEKIFDYQGLEITHPDSPVLVIDKNDVLHIVWSDIKNKGENGDIYYSRKTDSSWLTPINISQNSLTLSRLPNLIIDNKNQLHLVWSEMVGDKEQIFYTHSDENQNIWEAPKKIFSDTARSFVGVELATGSDGRLHLVWSSYGQNPSGIYYSHTEP